MHLEYFLLLITLKNINCYNPKRHALSSSNFQSINTEPVIPARYKIKSTTSYDEAITQDYFPEVEYPESIMDSSKPFYLSASPFPNDVKSSFKSLIGEGDKKTESSNDYSWIHNETQNEKNQEQLSSIPQKVGVNELTVTKGNGIISNDNGTNETLHKETPVLNFENDTADSCENGSDKLFTNWSSAEQSVGNQELDYVLGFINDLDELMKNITSIEQTGFIEGNNSTVNTFESECSNEFTLLTSDVTPNSNDSIIEFNGNSFPTEEHPERIRNPLFEESDTNDASSIRY